MKQMAVLDALRSNIKRLRKEQDLSQDDIATQIGVVRPVVSNWERGVSEPSLSQFVKLGQIFHVSLDALVSRGGSGKNVIVVDTSMLHKRPAILAELLEKFDEVIVPRVVIDELNYQKEHAQKPSVKKRAALIMNKVDELRQVMPKNLFTPEFKGDKNLKDDEKIARIALERADADFSDKVYMFAHDIWFSYLVRNQRGNLFLLNYNEYLKKFFYDSESFDMAKTQEFFATIKNHHFKPDMSFDPTIDINYCDPETGYTPLIQAICTRQDTVIYYIIEKCPVNLDEPDNYKYHFTPLLHAAQKQNLSLMKKLVEAGADIDKGSEYNEKSHNNYGNTPLMVCAWHGFIEGLTYLIEQGANLNQTDSNGYTALTKACIRGVPEAAALLIDGTDMNIRSRDHKKAIEYITPHKKGSDELYKLFKDREKEATK
ncbi:MAG: ankyrin repeat domain-containing protein [Spirochaetaceae bacterium]|jgi:transcriptional regulator with XRE-family HTH domain|nr:ankyrin repeat domain-containing protein [Spirochaetaceae bacterium]